MFDGALPRLPQPHRHADNAAMPNFSSANLSYDPLHGYIPFTSGEGAAAGVVSERQVIDHPWVQRMRYIHQLQTAWWVYASAEHTRFPHVLGAMHLASRAVEKLYPSLAEACPDVPSRGYVESLLRMAGLLHDVGHGPFGHFFDEHFLKQYGLTHETLGATIINTQLADLLRGMRRNPHSQLAEKETLDPAQIAWLIQRPKGLDAGDKPRWLVFLRSLLSGIYTIDNMDFVLRDAFMSGYSPRSFDLDRLLHYTYFSEQGLTLHDRGLEALIRFLHTRGELFRNLYFHRTVRAIDLTLRELFVASRDWLFPGNPLEHLDEYQHFTEFSLLVDAPRWAKSSDPAQRKVGEAWRDLFSRHVPWLSVYQRTIPFFPGESEQASIFSDERLAEAALRARLPPDLRDLPLRIDLARSIFRPNTQGPAGGQNFLFDSARKQVRAISAHDLIRRLPTSYRLCRVYAHDQQHVSQIAAAMDSLFGGAADDATNM